MHFYFIFSLRPLLCMYYFAFSRVLELFKWIGLLLIIETKHSLNRVSVVSEDIVLATELKART